LQKRVGEVKEREREMKRKKKKRPDLWFVSCNKFLTTTEDCSKLHTPQAKLSHAAADLIIDLLDVVSHYCCSSSPSSSSSSSPPTNHSTATRFNQSFFFFFFYVCV
jgi:hypothetical protein